MKLRLFAALAAATFACALPARAEIFPTRSMTMVIPFAAGGPTDILGRVIAARMSEVLGQTRHGRECRRRRRHDRLGARRQRDARRLSVRARHRRHPCPGPDALQEPALQRGDRFHAGHSDRQRSDRAGNAQGSAGQQFQGIRRLCQGEPGQDAVRLGRRRFGDASRLRAVELRHRRQCHARALSRHRARRCRISRAAASIICATSSRPRSRRSTAAR